MNKKMMVTISSIVGTIVGIKIGNMLYKKLFKEQIKEYEVREKQIQEEVDDLTKSMVNDCVNEIKINKEEGNKMNKKKFEKQLRSGIEKLNKSSSKEEDVDALEGIFGEEGFTDLMKKIKEIKKEAEKEREENGK